MKLVGPQTTFCIDLAQHIQCDFINMDRRVFPDGEVNPRIFKAPKEVILVNILSSSQFDPNKYLLECIFAIKNLKERGTETIVLVMPYLPYSRQDAVFRAGESFTSKYVLEIFKGLGVTDIFSVTYHLHRLKAANIVKGINLHDVSGVTALGDYLQQYNLESPLCVAPDEEAQKWAERVAEILKGDTAVLEKRRDTTTGEIKTRGVIPEKRSVIIVDDMISTGKTIQNAITICRQANATDITVCAVHGIFSQSVVWDVPVITTNTIENQYATVDVTPLLAERIAQEL